MECDEMGKYVGIFNKAWGELKNLDKNNEISLKKEADIQFMLGHLLIKNGLEKNEIHFEWSDGSSKSRCDIVLGKLGNEKLFIEIEDWKRDTIKKNVEKWDKDINKLIEWTFGSKKNTVRKPIFILFKYKDVNIRPKNVGKNSLVCAVEKFKQKYENKYWFKTNF
jgi:hypothetical protein